MSNKARIVTEGLPEGCSMRLELWLGIDPALLSTAQQKGVKWLPKGGVKFFTKGKVERSIRMIRNAISDATKDLSLPYDAGRSFAWVGEYLFVYRPKTIRKRQFGTFKVSVPDSGNLQKMIPDIVESMNLLFFNDSQEQIGCARKVFASAIDEFPHIEVAYARYDLDSPMAKHRVYGGN